jgi:hypothetical protein
MGRRGKKGKRNNNPGKRASKPNKPKQNDWADILQGGALKALELLPIVGPIVSAFRPDPVEQRLRAIANSVEEIAPHLIEELDSLSSICDVLETISENTSAQEKALEEIKDALTTFRAPDILGQFTAITILAEAVKDIKRLADAAEQMSGSLKGIEMNLSSVNLGGDYFPGRVHSYVRQMIEAYASSDVPHYFTVFHQGTVWWPKFADLERSNPLGPQYLGHRSDLDELCAFLADHVRPVVGPKAIFHVLMPTVGQVALKEAVKLPDAMHPCILDGQLGDAGTPFVYICLTTPVDKMCIRGIGILKPREIWAFRLRIGVNLPVLDQWLTHDCDISWSIDPSFRMTGIGNLFLVTWSDGCVGLEPTRTLGRPIEPGSRPWYTERSYA